MVRAICRVVINKRFCDLSLPLGISVRGNPGVFCNFLLKLKFRINQFQFPPGGGTSLWVRRGCAPVLGSFWPENSGIGVSFYWKVSVIGIYFHSEFSGIGGYSKFCNGC